MVVKEAVDIVKVDANLCEKGFLSLDLLCRLRKEAVCLVKGDDDVKDLVAEPSNFQDSD